MKLAPFEEQAINSLLSNQFIPEVLIAWSKALEVTKRDFNGYGYYLYLREQTNNSLGKIIKPREQNLTQGWYIRNQDEHHIGFILWMNENGEHSLECHPYDDKPIEQAILETEVTIR